MVPGARFSLLISPLGHTLRLLGVGRPLCASLSVFAVEARGTRRSSPCKRAPYTRRVRHTRGTKQCGTSSLRVVQKQLCGTEEGAVAGGQRGLGSSYVSPRERERGRKREREGERPLSSFAELRSRRLTADRHTDQKHTQRAPCHIQTGLRAEVLARGGEGVS
eukprot:1168675-Rhodomonas_salina.1